ncbi:MAG TPA: DUF1330 domain-containing protein [Gammaproteobacteria bacterium]|nr:DUF1330 domain-containing protein [Gammaproteobacteria bacterium]
MPAYLIVSYDITDAARYADYVAELRPLLERRGAEVLVIDPDAQAFEGERRSLHAVLRFASEQAARAFYFDPAFEPAKVIRRESCENLSVVLAQPRADDPASILRSPK